MSILVGWTNPNDVVMDSIEIYRANKRGGDKTKIVTLNKDVLNYLDEAVTNNTTYFYTIRFVKDDKFSESIEFPLGFYSDTGPGPKTILRGNWEFGLFGEVASTDLFDFSAIQAKYGINYNQNPGAPTLWLKWIVNGRIIYIPNSYYGVSATVNSDQFDVTKGFVPVNSDPNSPPVVMAKANYEYSIRPPYASINFTTAPNPNNDFVINGMTVTKYESTIGKSELAALFSMFTGPGSLLIPELNGLKYYDTTNPGINQGIITNTYLTPNVLFQSDVMSNNGSTLTGVGLPSGAQFIYWPVAELLF